MNESIAFSNKADFTQAAFDRVAEIVAQHGQKVLDCISPAFNTQKCLEHLAFVAADYVYDYSKIDDYACAFAAANFDFEEWCD